MRGTTLKLFNWSELGCRCSTKVRSKKEIFLCISQISIVTLYVLKRGKPLCIHIIFVPIVIASGRENKQCKIG